MNEEKKKIIQILRSLIISSPQNGKSLRDLERDYYELVQSKIRLFGYRNLEEFLRGTEEFIVKNFGSDLMIFAKPNPNSLHIANLVAETRTRNTGKRGSSSNAFRQTVRQPSPQSFASSSNSFSGSYRSPSTVLQKRYDNVSNVHQRSQAATIEFSIDQLKSEQARKNNAQNARFDNDVSSLSASANKLYEQSTVSVDSNTSRDYPLANQYSNPLVMDSPPITPRKSENCLSSQHQKGVQQVPPATTATIEFSIDQLKSEQARRNNAQKRFDNDFSSRSASANKLYEKQSTASVDSSTARDYPLTDQCGNPFVMDSPPITPKKSGSCLPNQHQKTAQQVSAPTTSAKARTDIQQLLSDNNKFFDAIESPPSIQTSRIHDHRKDQPKYHSYSTEKQNFGIRKSSVMNRLENLRQGLPANNLTKQNGDSPVAPQKLHVTPSSPTTSSSSSYESHLLDYCKEHRLNPPIFKIFEVNNRFECCVSVDNTRYSSYPTTDYSTPDRARLEIAKLALTKLRADKNQATPKACLDNEVDLTAKIYNCVKNNPNGVLVKRFPEMFLSLYKQLLPSDWMNAVAKHPECFTVEDCVDDRILSVVNTTDRDHSNSLNELILPWNDDCWSLVITCTVSTGEIWGRLAGKDNTNALQSLAREIKQELMQCRQIPKIFIIGQTYLVLTSKPANRVRVEKVDDSRQQCFCFCVDTGDRLWFNMNGIYVCPKKFLQLAPQAIRFALHGLEELVGNKFAKKHLDETLLNHLLLGQIFTKKEDFISQEESTIQVVLYDKSLSTGEVTNLQKVIVGKICGDMLSHLDTLDAF